MNFSDDHFKINPSNARELFSRSVSKIEIEISDFCNRVCSYCPNSFVDRRITRNKMDDALFTKIVSQLGEIKWNGTLCFHRYNEPLSDRPYAIARIREARKFLPLARLRIYTNGDYLNRDYLHELYAAGCRSICATIHVEPSEYSDESATAMLKKRLENLGYVSEIEKITIGVSAQVLVADDLDFIYRVQDFGRDVDGIPVRVDRGGSIDPHTDIVRTEPCVMPVVEMQIETDGTMMPCCHLRSDVAEHKGCSLGRLTPESDLFTEWTNATYVGWRKSMSSHGAKGGVCATCLYGKPEPTQTRLQQFGQILKSPSKSVRKLVGYAGEHGVSATIARVIEHING